MSKKKMNSLIRGIVCLFLCFSILFTSVSAKDSSEFYTNSNIEELFTFTIVGEDNNLDRPLEWISRTQSFIVVKKDGDLIRVYVNVPNLQLLVRNKALGRLSDGWDTEMYTPEDKLIKTIGTNSNNALDKFGFNLPTNKYNGEYPVVDMSMSGVIPTKWYQIPFKAVKAVFGHSIIDAPNIKDFRTITYYNYKYLDEDQEKLINLVQDTWKDYEASLFSGDKKYAYFKNPEQCASMFVADAEGEEAQATAERLQPIAEKLIKQKKDRALYEKHYMNHTSMYAYDADYRKAYDDFTAYQEELSRWKANNVGTTSSVPIVRPNQPSSSMIIGRYTDTGTSSSSTSSSSTEQTSTPPPAYVKRPSMQEYRMKVFPDYTNGIPSKLTSEEENTIDQYTTACTVRDKWLLFVQYMENGFEHRSKRKWKEYSSNLWAVVDNAKDKVVSLFTGNREDVFDWNTWFEGTSHTNYYSQCLLVPDKPGTCTKTINGQEFSGTLFDIYIRSSLYKKTWDKKEITRNDAIYIINTIQKQTGPAYTEIMDHLAQFLRVEAIEAGTSSTKYEVIDPRTMPYDKNTLTLSEDREYITEEDPRVKIYKDENLVGSAVVSGDLDLSKLISIKNILYRLIISTGGLLAKLSCFFNDLVSFKIIRDLDLMPADNWDMLSYKVLVLIIAVFAVASIIKSTFEFLKGRGGLNKLLTKSAYFFLLIALVTMMTVNKGAMWNSIEKVANATFNIGENIAIDKEGFEELYGNGENGSVAYYVPYFNLWTKYMTGYQLNDDAQVIDIDADVPEVKELERDGETKLPQINDTDTKLWSVVLADSFNTEGKSTNIRNGDKVNSNAYRVVDHFLAPRVTSANPSKDNLDIVNTQNENYNSEFQNPNVFTMLGLLMSIFNLFVIVLMKVLTFIWFWYLLYMFSINIVLSMRDKAGIKGLLIKTFSPLLFIPLLGAYAGITINIGMKTDGITNLILNFGILSLTAVILNAWRNSNVFPRTLAIVNVIMSPISASIGLRKRVNKVQSDYLAKQHGVQKDEEGNLQYKDFIAEDGELLEETTDREPLRREFNDQILAKYANGDTDKLADAERLYAEKYLKPQIDAGAKSMADWEYSQGDRRKFSIGDIDKK